jgi:phosphatidylserine/phosphatidylglycerophosphate/cardiolipin synthase-like enzyme
MRFKSQLTNGYQIFAVSGVNTISFAIDAAAANTAGLLGFAVERVDPAENQQYYVYGFKVFPSVIPQPTPQTVVSTYEHPVQSFVWDDFTAKDGRKYKYIFHPLKGQPKNLDRSEPPIEINVETELLFDDAATHQVFFNRGVASSQAYVRRFGNLKPDDQPTPAKRQEALDWLSRELDDAILKFIGAAQNGDTLLCCFYEFRYRPVVQALKDAIGNGVNVQIIVDAKVNEYTDKDGVFHESFPRTENLDLIQSVGLPVNSVIHREARTSAIAHNKFMVLLKGQAQAPAEVWTGSTNISLGGIFGQTNVGHWVRDHNLATQFAAYWNLLKNDPGGTAADSSAVSKQKNKAFRQDVETLFNVPTDWTQVPQGITPAFSPRNDTEVLTMYATMVDAATDLSCITLAFGINKEFKDQLKDNTPSSHIAFFLLEKKDVPNPKNPGAFIEINARQNVYKAWGSYIKDKVYQWAKETNNRALQFNTHVAYVHSKFLLKDPLGLDLIVVTGSANFSDDSQKENDENMIIIRGDKRVADIYFTEFNRLFNHYYFRSVMETLNTSQPAAPQEDSLMLAEDDTWLAKYAPGKLRFKRVQEYKKMQGFA